MERALWANTDRRLYSKHQRHPSPQSEDGRLSCRMLNGGLAKGYNICNLTLFPACQKQNKNGKFGTEIMNKRRAAKMTPVISSRNNYEAEGSARCMRDGLPVSRFCDAELALSITILFWMHGKQNVVQRAYKKKIR